MDTQADQLIGTVQSIEANDLRQRSQRAFRMAVVLGLTAMTSFGLFGLLMFVSAFGLSPLRPLESVGIGVALLLVMLVAVPACWIFAGRSAYLRSRLVRHVEHAARPTNA
jgi:hypothetical protein